MCICQKLLEELSEVVIEFSKASCAFVKNFMWICQKLRLNLEEAARGLVKSSSWSCQKLCLNLSKTAAE